MELICDCWLIDASVSKYGLTDAERKLRMMDKLPGLAEAIARDDERRAVKLRMIVEGNNERAVALAAAGPDPSRGSEAAEIEILKARRACHYVYKVEMARKEWVDVKLLCGRPAYESTVEPYMVHRLAMYNADERATCEDCLRIASCVPVHMVERDVY